MYLKIICLIETLVRPQSVKALTTAFFIAYLIKYDILHAQNKKFWDVQYMYKYIQYAQYIHPCSMHTLCRKRGERAGIQHPKDRGPRTTFRLHTYM